MKDLIKKYLQAVTLTQDKANHAFQGLLIYSLLAFYSPLVAIVVVLVVGFGKEVLDGFIGGTVDKWDIVATISAPFLLYVISLVFSRT